MGLVEYGVNTTKFICMEVFEMVCQIKNCVMKIDKKKEPEKLLIITGRYCVEANIPYGYMPKSMKKEIKEVIRFVNLIRVISWFRPRNEYIDAILLPFYKKYKGKTIYWWLKKSLKKIGY